MIILKNPKNGDKIDLLTDIQIGFLESDRSMVEAINFDYLNLQKVGKVDCSFPKGVVFEWEAEGESIVQISEDEAFKSYYTAVGNKTCHVDNLKCNTHYFWRVVCGNEISEVFYFDTTDRFPRFIKIDGLTNVRDCGGWKTITGKRIKQGLLYRGSEMNAHVNITNDGLRTMREVLKIKSVLDIRGISKKEAVEDVYKGNYMNIPCAAYREWLKQPPEVAKEIFEFLTNEDNYPVYFHCWGGADRAGTLAFLVGAVLGMSYKDLIDDYECTSLSIWGARTRNLEVYCKGFLDDFNAFEGKTTEEKAENYFLSCGVSKDLISRFRNFMLY